MMAERLRVLPTQRRTITPPSRPRRMPTPRQIARRQRGVQIAKLSLPLLAALLISLLLFWQEIEGRESRLSFRRGPAITAESLQIVSPRFQGVDELQRPYTITARHGRQPGQEEIMLLEAPRADILLSDGAWILVEADRGRYERETQRLELDGDVRVWHDSGVLFRTEQALVRLDAKEAEGDRPTRAQAPFGTIESEGFEMREGGAVMIFTGRAHAVLEGRQQ
jgi:lipopolysaccharide export system protein LptC